MKNKIEMLNYLIRIINENINNLKANEEMYDINDIYILIEEQQDAFNFTPIEFKNFINQLFKI